MFNVMGVFDKVGRAIEQSFNALLDKAEDPGKSLALTLEEMRQHIRDARREVVRRVATEKQLKKSLEQLDHDAERWHQRAQLAVRHGDDELARQALLHRRRASQERERVSALRAEQHAAALEMKSDLARMERRLQELVSRKGTLAVQMQRARAGGGPEALGAVGGATPFDEFRRIEEEVSGVEIAFEAQQEVEAALGGAGPTGMTTAEVEARFLSLEGKPPPSPGEAEPGEVDQELEALKQRYRVRT
jgi:phage shock protein A